MGVPWPCAVHCPPPHQTASRRQDGDSPIVLRRPADDFFGKIIKVSPIVMVSQPPKRPIFNVLRRLIIPLILLAAVLASHGRSLGEPPIAPQETVYGRGGRPGQPAGGGEAPGQAERIVSTTLAGLARAESISARVRQRVRIGDRVLVGAGRYVQLGTGVDQRFRFESSMQCDTESFEVLDVCDGVFSWSYERLGSNPPQLKRIDVRRVREKLEQLKVLDRLGVSPYLGGIHRSLALTRQWFRFDTVESSMIDDVAVWSIEGRWHAAALAALLPDRAEAITSSGGIEPAQLPDGMPWSVRFSIGKRELFPFRVEWLAIPGDRPVAPVPPEPIAVMELYDVRIGGAVDASAFVYKPAMEGLIDVTDGIVQQLTPFRE